MSAHRATGLFHGLFPRLTQGLCLCMCLLAVPAAWAQSPADAASRALLEQRRADERLQQQREALTPHAGSRGVREAPPRPAPLDWPGAESPCFVVREIVLTGEDSHRFGFALDDLVSGDDPAIGRCLGAQGVGVAAERAQRAVLSRGFVTSRVLVPPQQLGAGRLELSVLAGRVRALRFAEGTDLRATARNALPVQAGDVLDLRDIEQGLENFKRLPSVTADIVIEPAERPGQSDLVIAWRQPNPFRFQLSLDDSGTRATGRYQGRITVHYDHWWTLNDLLYLSLSHDLGGGEPGQRGSGSEAVHYSLPWGHWLLGFTASSSRYHQNVAGPYEVFRYSGVSDDAGLSLSRLLRRDARSKTSLELKAWARRSRNFIDDTELEPQRRATGGWALGIAHQQAFAAATLDLQLTHRRGTGAFHAQPAPEEAFGEGTSRLRVTSLDLQLQAPWRLAAWRGRYQGTLRGQWNGTPLTPQDRFAIGGRYTVRGFDGETSLAGERGLLLRNELSVALGQSAHELYAGIDHGEVGGPSVAWQAGDHLSGAVLGLRGSVGAVGYEVFIARPIRQPKAFGARSAVAGFSLSAAF